MPAPTRLKQQWAEEKHDNVSASAPTAVSSASSFASGAEVWAYQGQDPNVRVDVADAHVERSDFDAVVPLDVWRLLDRRLLNRWYLAAMPEAEQAPVLTTFVPIERIRNIVWSAHVLDESLSHALDSARRQIFDDLVTTWQTETVFVSSVTEKWSHPAYQQIIAMGKPAIPLILEQIGDGERLWTQALLSITSENPAEATRTPEEAQEAWLKWGEVSGWLNP